jgi:hypothetical protein
MSATRAAELCWSSSQSDNSRCATTAKSCILPSTQCGHKYALQMHWHVLAMQCQEPCLLVACTSCP